MVVAVRLPPLSRLKRFWKRLKAEGVVLTPLRCVSVSPRKLCGSCTPVARSTVSPLLARSMAWLNTLPPPVRLLVCVVLVLLVPWVPVGRPAFCRPVLPPVCPVARFRLASMASLNLLMVSPPYGVGRKGACVSPPAVLRSFL